MRLTQILNRQHVGFMFKKHWLVQGKRVPINTKVEEYLKSKGIPVEDALEFVKENRELRERSFAGHLSCSLNCIFNKNETYHLMVYRTCS